jgi:hypothetical protein
VLVRRLFPDPIDPGQIDNGKVLRGDVRSLPIVIG